MPDRSATPADSPPTPGRKGGRWGDRPGATAAVLLAYLLVYFAMKFGTVHRRSATFDEPIHLTAGYAALVQRDYRVDPTHPPFLRMWAALPLLAFEPGPLDSSRIDVVPQPDWMPQAYQYAHDFLYAGPHADRNLNAARGMIILLGALTGVLLFCWAREWLGFFPAGLALLCYVLEPNLGAHATLVTTDCGITCFFFGTIYFFWRTWRNFTAWNLAGLALFFSLACVSKYNALLLLPVGAVLLVVTTRRGGPLTLGRAAGVIALLAASATLMIWAVYGFRHAPSATPGWMFHFTGSAGGKNPLPWTTAVLDWIDFHQLLPNAYTQGFLLGVSDAQPLPSYLAGNISTTGWWYFFPAVFLLKTPVSLLLLLATGLVALAVRRQILGGINALMLLVPIVVYFGIAIASDIQLGVRHLLPVYPFVILIACVTGWEVARSTRHRRLQVAGLGLLLAFWVASFIRVYPHGLTFFNALAGGPQGGGRFLTDSNLDWGQHLKLLKEWMDDNQVDRINLAYFGTADPEYYDINYVSLPPVTPTFNRRYHARPELPGLVAISATTLSGVYLGRSWQQFYSGFRSLKPLAVIGNTINVYRIDRWPEPADPGQVPPDVHRELASALLRLGWPDHAVLHFRYALAQQPDDPRAHRELGWALHQLRRHDEALQAFQRAVALDPPDGEGRTGLISQLIQLHRAAEAVAAAQDWVRLQPRSAVAYHLQGLAFAAANQPDAAEASFGRAHLLAPHNAVIREQYEKYRKPAGVAR